MIENNIPNDIDIAIIFQKIPLKEQLSQAQEIKNQLQKLINIPIHITAYDFYSFFNKGNFAKEDILFYGKSLISNNYFSKLFDLNPRIQISYFLEKLKKKDKVRFHYMLKGKKGKYGLLKAYGGELLNPGLIEIYPEYEKIFLNAIKQITPNFKLKKIFLLE
ncbi:hypothetical protein HY498_01220 [Candidatus Woesearchaeota archaeon]|nr:hypothetical protein [Candidatus Woesearchaeota archaeon]